MSRFLGPRLRIIRRLGKLPGLTLKRSIKRNSPGQHGQTSPGQKKKRNRKKKEKKQYSSRLEEKQKLRFHYGITERQLLNYIRRAKKVKGSTGEVLLEFLEMRLDCLVFRLGFAPTIPAARQLVNHGHILVNTKVIDIPSYRGQRNDRIEIKNTKASRNLTQSQFYSQYSESKDFSLPNHLMFAPKGSQTGLIQDTVDRSNISLNVKERLVVEYYSRKI